MTESLQLQGQSLRLRLTSHRKSFAMTGKAVEFGSRFVFGRDLQGEYEPKAPQKSTAHPCHASTLRVARSTAERVASHSAARSHGLRP